ncbi:MAG: restriction endonuclease subunit S [Candidatus Methanoperedens sp.]|nr:restriction endonuclease subunit S [Candidatus Methanoperedens sp.]
MNKESDIKILLNALGFLLEDNSKGIYYKKYESHSNYIIKLNFDKDEIDYGTKIILGDKTTSNFKASENFVVLECVNRLLEKGYSPESITLEKDYPLGHKNKGKLDILVTDKGQKSYLMIECKTWGNEYDKAIKKTLNDGGQLISYFQQDKSTKFLCLYTSKIENRSIVYKNSIIKIEADFNQATNTLEVFEKWNKNLKDNGIFESWAAPYNISIKALTKSSLIPLTKEDSSRIFNQFAEILRHNVVSDKPNAFNKLITLLLCKIVDEDRGENDELHFQWLENDTDINLQKRLNDLYKTGMEKYLTKVVTDYSDSDVEEIIGLSEEQKGIIKKMMTELRLKKNNEFAFKEVFNDASFEENSKVLREVVELFQPYQVRYNKKQQFLGDFFELLLNTSIKQEAGQFFTPVPIARFIINSIPLRKIILNKIAKGDTEFLPYVIDYAEGSGHFLTEVMDEIHNIILELNEKNDFKPSIKKKLNVWTDDYVWAYEFVYGIEKDYRLVKTAKVSCFLNGDGLARIFNADGLANFETDSDYKDKLKITSKADPKDNQQFEVLVANPPYSVSSFKNTLINGDKSFELFNRLTNESSEIECLFIERTKQLLKDGGYAGIILPSSILSKTGIYGDAREILLKYFKIVAITEFGSNTFMATGTNTVTLFLERRNNADWQKIQHTVNNFFTNSIDVACNGIENPFSKFVAHVYKTVSFEDYISFINQKPNENIKKHELFEEYQKSFENSTVVINIKKKPAFKSKPEKEQQAELDTLFYSEVFKTEKEKLLYFILAYPQKTLLIKANPNGENETEKEFLGYEFSNRRGHEGIKPYGAKSIQEATKLYDDANPLNPEKTNYYIYNSFLGHEITISENLKGHINKQNLVDMMNFDRVEFTKSISPSVKKKAEIESKWELVRLGSVTEIFGGGTPDTKIAEYWNGEINWATLIDTKNKYLYATQRKITALGLQNSNATLLPVNTVIFSSRATIGDITIAKVETATNQGYKNFICNPDKILYEFLYFILKHDAKNIAELASGTTYPEINKLQIADYKIPLPPKNIQEKIINEIKIIETEEIEINKEIERVDSDIETIIQKANQFNKNIKIGKVCSINAKSGDPRKIFGDNVFTYIDIDSVEGHTGEINYSQKITGNNAPSRAKRIAEDDSVVISTVRPNLKAFTYIERAPSDAIFSTGFAILKSKDENILVTKLLFHYFLHSTDLMKQMQDIMLKAQYPSINKTDIENFLIPLPPIKEQLEIISEINKLEIQISEFKNLLKNTAIEKNVVLKKYLE